MLVAIKTVHWANGFEAGNNGFEIPLYYLLMLFVLFVYGGRRFSLDRAIDGKYGKQLGAILKKRQLWKKLNRTNWPPIADAPESAILLKGMTIDYLKN